MQVPTLQVSASLSSTVASSSNNNNNNIPHYEHAELHLAASNTNETCSGNNNNATNAQTLKRSLLITCAGCPVQSPSTPSHQYYNAASSAASAASCASSDTADSAARTTVERGLTLGYSTSLSVSSQLLPEIAPSNTNLRRRGGGKSCNVLQSLVVGGYSAGGAAAGSCGACCHHPRSCYPGLTMQQSQAMQKYCTLRRAPYRRTTVG